MSQRIPFLKPKMAGRRFDDHAIPLEMLKDIAVLEEMILEVAKWHYLNDHPERTRSPKGFTKGISIKLAEIGEGSAVPDMALFVDEPQLIAPENQLYFERARDSIVNAIAAAKSDLDITAHLPESLLSFFDKLGRGLRDNEVIDFAPEDAARQALLNRTTRRRLIMAASQLIDISEEVTLRGVIPKADQEKLNFELITIAGHRVAGPIRMQHLETILSAFNGYREGLRVSIQGIARYNRQGQLKSIDEIEHVTLLDPLDIGARIDELRLLQNGWLDGVNGAQLDPGQLDWLEHQLDVQLVDDHPLPFLYPTAEGGVQIEWSIGDYEITLDADLHQKTGHFHAMNMRDDTDVTEQEVDLFGDDGWSVVNNQLASVCGERNE